MKIMAVASMSPATTDGFRSDGLRLGGERGPGRRPRPCARQFQASKSPHWVLALRQSPMIFAVKWWILCARWWIFQLALPLRLMIMQWKKRVSMLATHTKWVSHASSATWTTVEPFVTIMPVHFGQTLVHIADEDNIQY